MSVISFIAVVFLAWLFLLKHHFNAALESAEYHLLIKKKKSPEKPADFHLYCSCYDGTIFLEKNFQKLMK